MSGATFLIASQIATKAFTFVSNQLLVQKISPEIFGMASYLEFIVSSILFFSREAERMAVQRATSSSKTALRQKITNFAFIPLALGIPISVLMFFVNRASDSFNNGIALLPFKNATLVLLVALVLMELVAEPLFALNQYQLNFRARSKIDSVAVFAKCATTFLGVLVAKKYSPENFDGLAVASFALGQASYSLATLVGYWWASSFQISGITEIEEEGKKFYFDRNISNIWKSLFVQMIFKHLLTEGDTLLIGYLFSAADQGVYSVICNYGSILARLLFQPIEEFLRVSFTRTFAGKNANVASSYLLMEHLLVFYFNLSLLIALGGFTNGSFMLHTLLGRNEKWKNSSVFEYFPQYLLYLPFMAFNGILEAFFSSASSQTEIKSFSKFMSVLSAAVLGLLYVLVNKYHMGLSGLILANMTNMLLRIGYCFVFFVSFFHRNGIPFQVARIVRRILVPFLTVLTTVGVQYFILASGLQTTSFVQFSKSVVLCVVCLLVMLVNERQALLVPVRRILKREKKD